MKIPSETTKRSVEKERFITAVKITKESYSKISPNNMSPRWKFSEKNSQAKKQCETI